MRFPEDNKIMYGQDFSWWYGVPHNVDFEVCDVQLDKVWLKAPGYGGNPYGNGRIVIYLKTIADKEKKPEPEKCEACKEADKLHPFVPEGGCYFTEKRVEYLLSDHLRKFHCTCKKESL